MSQAAAGGGGRAEVERRLLYRGAFRTRTSGRGCLLTPRRTVEQELGSRLPEGVRGKGGGGERRHHLPGASQAPRRLGAGGELSDQELEAVAGVESRLGERADAQTLMLTQTVELCHGPC